MPGRARRASTVMLSEGHLVQDWNLSGASAAGNALACIVHTFFTVRICGQKRVRCRETPVMDAVGGLMERYTRVCYTRIWHAP